MLMPPMPCGRPGMSVRSIKREQMAIQLRNASAGQLASRRSAISLHLPNVTSRVNRVLELDCCMLCMLQWTLCCCLCILSRYLSSQDEPALDPFSRVSPLQPPSKRYTAVQGTLLIRQDRPRTGRQLPLLHPERVRSTAPIALSESEAFKLTYRASKLKLAGWVKNNSDDSVEGAAAGPAPAIQSLSVFCWLLPMSV